MDREIKQDDAGSPRDYRPTTPKDPENELEKPGDAADAVGRASAVATRVEEIERGKTKRISATLPKPARKVKGEYKRRADHEKSTIKELEVMHASQMREKEEELQRIRAELEKEKKVNACGSRSSGLYGSRSSVAKWSAGTMSTCSSVASGHRPSGQLKHGEKKASGNTCENDEQPLTRRQIAARRCLPKSLPVFNGVPDEWPLFLSSFEDTTKACGFSNLENLQRLRECLRGDALEAVKGRLVLSESVPMIIEELRSLFGRPRRILRTLLAKVRNVPPPNADRLETFIAFGVAVSQLVGHIIAAGLMEHLDNPLLVEELEEKLPPSYQLEWVRHRRYNCGKTLQVFADFLEGLVADISEIKDFVSTEHRPQRPPIKPTTRTEKRAYMNVHSLSKDAEATEDSCLICERPSHKVRNCDKFISFTVAERLEHVTKLNLCENCLNNHGNRACWFKRSCGTDGCNVKHHSLLHPTPRKRCVEEQCNAHNDLEKNTIFRMMPVTLSVGEKTFDTIAFLDEGASGTFIEDMVANELQAKGVIEPLIVTWSADVQRCEEHSRKVDIMLQTKDSDKKYLLQGARTVSKLVLPKQKESYQCIKARYPHLRDVQVEDMRLETPRILLGLDNLHLFAPLESKIGQPGEPIGVKSRLGWSIYGPEWQVSTKERLNYHNILTVSNEELHDAIRVQYNLENTGITFVKLPVSKEESRALETLQATTTRIGNRFETGLLWKTDKRKFPESYTMAKRRLEGMKRKLAKDEKLRDTVLKMISEYEKKQYAHKLTQEELEDTEPSSIWYLPLNVVQNPNKPGKIRLVWDAAATVGGVSLNSELLKGPDLLCSLPSVLCPFRERPFGFGGDIQEMYHQIAIRNEDKQAQRFLFPDADKSEPQIYVMDVATFGSTCSPCSAQFVKNKNAVEFSSQFPEACEAIKNRHYVDDYYDSADTLEEAVTLAKQVTYVHSKGGFHMRNWVSNDETFCIEMGEKSPMKAIHFKEKIGEGTAKVDRVLGIMWDVKDDTFKFNAPCKAIEHNHPVKRVVLSSVMSMFDPMGYLSPFTVIGKMIVQDLWRTGCDWDEPIDEATLHKWNDWRALMPKIKDIAIPRAYFKGFPSKQIQELQLHIFTDASQSAYGCVAYFRSVFEGEVRCSLVMSKSKVAPIKQRTIPQLELCAAVLGARLLKTVGELHRFTITKQFLWCDSRTVLSWIRSDQHRYKPFVAFRIGEILDLTKVTDWRWVPSNVNVADKLTKPSKEWCFDRESMWQRGPEFLYGDESTWPEQPQICANVSEEIRAIHLFHDVKIQEPIIDVSRISKWTVLVRTVACTLRFISNCRKKRNKLEIETLVPTMEQKKKIIPIETKVVRVPLKQEEFHKAECILIRVAQAEAYGDELKVLYRNKDQPLNKWHQVEKSSVLYRLTPLIDGDGIIRMEGRAMTSDTLPFNLRFPIILPKEHEVTKRLIQWYHESHGHAFREAVKNDLRQRYFIPNINAAVQRVSSSCIWCKVNRNRPTTPRVAQLPSERVPSIMRPFSSVGVDYFGPVEVVVGRSRRKRWIVLFTCLAIRAVHLEVASDLSASSCLMAIRRFVCRRGPPSEFFSDNGTNLKAASKEIRETDGREDNMAIHPAGNTTYGWLLGATCEDGKSSVAGPPRRCSIDGRTAVNHDRRSRGHG